MIHSDFLLTLKSYRIRQTLVLQGQILCLHGLLIDVELD